MTFAYDRQTIVQHEPNPADKTIPQGTAFLEEFAEKKNIPVAVVDLPVTGQVGQLEKMAKLVAGMSPKTANSRLYMQGHGCWMMQTIGGVDARTWARTLLNAGLHKTKIISITACSTGRDRDVMDNRVVESANSFASQFHQALMDMARLDTVIYARVYNVIVYPGGKGTSDRKENVGPAKSRTKSKLRFSWQSGKQHREWVDYSAGGTSSLGSLPRASGVFE